MGALRSTMLATDVRPRKTWHAERDPMAYDLNWDEDARRVASIVDRTWSLSLRLRGSNLH
jgi:hypothetical protein